MNCNGYSSWRWHQSFLKFLQHFSPKGLFRLCCSTLGLKTVQTSVTNVVSDALIIAHTFLIFRARHEKGSRWELQAVKLRSLCSRKQQHDLKSRTERSDSQEQTHATCKIFSHVLFKPAGSTREGNLELPGGKWRLGEQEPFEKRYNRRKESSRYLGEPFCHFLR